MQHDATMLAVSESMLTYAHCFACISRNCNDMLGKPTCAPVLLLLLVDLFLHYPRHLSAKTRGGQAKSIVKSEANLD